MQSHKKNEKIRSVLCTFSARLIDCIVLKKLVLLYVVSSSTVLCAARYLLAVLLDIFLAISHLSVIIHHRLVLLVLTITRLQPCKGFNSIRRL